MRSIFAIVCCATLSLMTTMPLHAADSSPPATKLDEAVVGQFVQLHCTRCHGAAKQSADVRLDTLSFSINNSDQAQRWQDVLDVLNGGNMPPKEEMQPTSASLETVIGELTDKLIEARKRLAESGGSVLMRRLNRREYAATIRHLFGFEPPAGRIPPDDDVVNFDTVGSRQIFTASHFDEYYAIAQEVLLEGFKWAGVREPVQTRVQEPEEFWNATYRRDLERWKGQEEGKVVRLSRLREEYLARPKVESGVYLDEALRHLAFGRAVDPRGSYRIRVKAGIEGEVVPFRRFIRLIIGDDALAVLRIDGTSDNPAESMVEIHRPALLGRQLGGSVAEDRNGAWLSHYLASIKRHEGIDPSGEGLIWIDSFSIDGPFYPEERNFFDSLLCPEPPTQGKRTAMVWHDKNARELIERFTFEAFRRRKSAPEYIDQLASYFQNQRDKGKSFEHSIADTLAVVMASPGFLYLSESAANVSDSDSEVREDFRRRDLTERKTDTPGGFHDGNEESIGSREIAIRLSYFLTSGPPDEKLYQAVESGAMFDSKAFHREVDRLLAGPQSRRFAEALAAQWADFNRLDGISVSDEFPTYTQGLRHSMKQEVIAFFHTLIDQNLPVRNLIQSDFVTVNAQLAVHYGIPGVMTNDFKPVKLPAASPRGGYLTQAAFLVAGSNGERTSPTVRGMLLMSRFLNSPPAPPPPNVPELGSGVDGPSTNRDLVELHQTRAQCASCHRRMDTIGLALENFDLLGRYRETEKVGRDKQPVRISGAMPGGKPFSSFPGFRSTVLEHEEDLARNMIESLLIYALGRDIEFTDGPEIEKLLVRLRPNHFRMQDMIHAVAESPLFVRN